MLHGSPDFFVSHAGRDSAWAEWLGWQLQEAGYTVELDIWDWKPGHDFVTRMSEALDRADRVVAVWTEAYFASTFAGAEFRAAFARHAKTEGRIVPVLVEPVKRPALYATIVYIDLVGLDEETAAARLRSRLTVGRPVEPPSFPRPTARRRPAFAGSQPDIWRVPARNPHFTGRETLLGELHQRLCAQEGTLVVQTLYGLGGVGKTQLVLEYAHRYASDYDLVWWIDAGQSLLIANQLATLAVAIGISPGPTVADTAERLLADLRSRDRWILIFDNAERPQDVADYRPGGAGHVLITSRFPGWGGLGGRLEVDVMVRSETIALLKARVADLADELADELAVELGDLPLAAAQAAAFLEQTGLPAADYLRRFRTRRAALLARGDVLGYHGRIDTAWALSLERLRDEDPAAVALLELAAFLAPEPIPLSLLSDHAELLTGQLRTAAADPDTLGDAVGALVGYSLVRRHSDSFQMHRLVQAVVRQQFAPDQQRAAANRVLALLASASPDDPEDPRGWPTYARLTPHILATDFHDVGTRTGRQLTLKITRYLQAHGDSHASRTIIEQALDGWRGSLGPDHPDTLAAASILALVLDQLGDAESARAIGEDTLERCRRTVGPDHMTTLWTAAALVVALGQVDEAEMARTLGEDTLQRCRRVLGPNHPTTLWAAAALTLALDQVGEAESARNLGEDTLQRCRRVLGPDHATTLGTAAPLTLALIQVGDIEAARALGEDTMERCRRVHGPDHPRTLWSAANLSVALSIVGVVGSAHALGADTLQRCRRILGSDNQITLLAAAGLIVTLVRLGEAEPARALGEDTLERCRRVLGPSNQLTLYVTLAVAATEQAPNGGTIDR